MGILDRYFKVTPSEQHIVQRVLAGRRAVSHADYGSRVFTRPTVGIPQGNTLSLFLANVACHELDLAMEDSGVQFARFADDIVVLAVSDRAATNAFEAIMTHCDQSGVSVSFTKSPGISELSPQALSRVSVAPVADRFNYIGHRFSYTTIHRKNDPAARLVTRLSLRHRSVKRLRERLSSIIFTHLLKYPEQGEWNPNRLYSGIDWDLVRCINDLRAWMYAGMSEEELLAGISGQARLHRLDSTMGFYALTNDVEQLAGLDGWLASALANALKRREGLLADKFGVAGYPSLSRDQLVTARWYANRMGSKAVAEVWNDVRLPSLLRAWKYAQRCLGAFNLQQLPTRSGLIDDST